MKRPPKVWGPNGMQTEASMIVELGFCVPYLKWAGTPVLIRKDPRDAAGGLEAFRGFVAKPGVPFKGAFIEEERSNEEVRGWIDINFDDRAHYEALSAGHDAADRPFRPGTYELMGPLVRGNPAGLQFHTLVPHYGEESLIDRRGPMSPTYANVRQYLIDFPNIHGLAWYTPDHLWCATMDRVDYGLPPVRRRAERPLL